MILLQSIETPHTEGTIRQFQNMQVLLLCSDENVSICRETKTIHYKKHNINFVQNNEL